MFVVEDKGSSRVRLMKKIFFSLLKDVVCGVPLKEEIKNLIDKDVLQSLYNLSKKHDLAHLVGDALEKNGLLNDSAEMRAKFLKEKSIAISRYEQRRYEYDKIINTLEKAQIPFIPLKGAIIQDLYPEAWMRTSCDIDILVKEENLNLAIETLEKELEYTCHLVGGHDAQMVAPSGVHLELHYTLTHGEATLKQKDFFESVWEFDEKSESFFRCMSSEHFYGYFIMHMANHVRVGGCGVRPFLDFYLMLDKGVFDINKHEKTLQELGLFAFAKAVKSLVEVWFLYKDASELDEEFERYVLSGGVYGTMQNRVLVKTKGKKSKSGFILSRIFLPYSDLKNRYPILRKHKILTPFYQVKRWFSLVKKDKRKKATNEFKTTVNQDEIRSEKISKLFNNLGL